MGIRIGSMLVTVMERYFNTEVMWLRRRAVGYCGFILPR